MLQDLNSCHTELERSMCKTVCGLEIRETAQQLAQTGRLTGAEAKIAAEFGYKPNKPE